MNSIRTRVIKLGSSHAIRVPSSLLEQIGCRDEVELEVQPGQIIVRPAPSLYRHNWGKAFREMAEHGDDRLIDDTIHTLTQWDMEEWEW